MTDAEPRVPSFVMDLRETTPVLHPLVAELVADERLAAYAEALPAPARVSEPALPLVLAALHEQRADQPSATDPMVNEHIQWALKSGNG